MYLDNPIIDKKQDEFKRFPFCQRVAEVIASRQDSGNLVVGIYGAWGEGKTTAINFIEQELTEKGNIVCIKFNPWQFSNEELLLMSFFETISNALGIDLKDFIDKSSNFVNKYVQPIITPVINIFDKTKISGLVAQFVIKIMFSPSTLEKYKEKVKSILNEKQKKLVIFIDDIDRLDKSEIQAIFKLVKISADFSYTTYVLAFDQDMVASALNEKYGHNNPEAGRNFLEKIIQVPLNLPKIKTTLLRKRFLELLNKILEERSIDLKQQDYDTFVGLYQETLESRITTPRMLKRYINALNFSLGILKDEVNPIDLMLIEGIKICYPDVYDCIKKYGWDNLADQKYDGQKQKKKISKFFINDLVDNKQRISNNLYFDRYFSYAILDDDISDQELDKFLSSINSSSSRKEINELFINFVNKDNYGNFLAKIDNKKDIQFTEDQRENIVTVILDNMDLCSKNNIEYSAILVSSLIKKSDNYLDKLKHIIDDSKSVQFCIYLINHKNYNHRDPDKTITKQEIQSQSQQEQDIYIIFCEKIKNELQQAFFTENYDIEDIEDRKYLDSMIDMWTLYGDQKQVKTFLKEKLENNQNQSQSLTGSILRKWLDFWSKHRNNIYYSYPNPRDTQDY